MSSEQGMAVALNSATAELGEGPEIVGTAEDTFEQRTLEKAIYLALCGISDRLRSYRVSGGGERSRQMVVFSDGKPSHFACSLFMLTTAHFLTKSSSGVI